MSLILLGVFMLGVLAGVAAERIATEKIHDKLKGAQKCRSCGMIRSRVEYDFREDK